MPSKLIAGRYEIEQELGRGGMGQVFRARDTRLGRTVALKMIPAELHHDVELRRRLAQEARAASALTHPGIATVYDFEEHAGESFIVFEYVEGSTLREFARQHRFTTEEILEVGVQLAEALAAAHERGIVHRDLKPENIMLTPGPERLGRVKVLDFGLAKVFRPLQAAQGVQSEAETAAIATARGLLVGTVNYMAPEQVEGEPADARSDLYAAGLVLYELATGLNPFVGKTSASTIANILKLEAPPLAERSPAAPAELDRILRKGLRKRPEERYQSARELRVDLANLRRDSARPVAPSRDDLYQPSEEGARAFPRQMARGLFAAIQAGYLAMYGVFFYALGSQPETPERAALMMLSAEQVSFLFPFFLMTAVVGVPVRLYLLTAVSADYSETGTKYKRLFPVVLLFDLVWALGPTMMSHILGLLAFPCIAALLYLPFAQRRLLYDAYSPSGGRASGIRRSA